MPLSATERAALIDRYERGPDTLRAAFERVPEAARQWRPGPNRWSAHEVVCHCADSESNAMLRIRYLVAEKEPLIVGYDEAEWARRFDYHTLPVDKAMRTVEAVRAFTTELIRRLPESAWASVGRHTESGVYRAEDWLRIYAEHLEKHSGQIERNLASWNSSAGGQAPR
jgi:hypothetical protein